MKNNLIALTIWFWYDADKKYGIINRLEDVMEVRQEKWREIGRDFLNVNFQVKPKKPRDLSKLRPQERTFCLEFIHHLNSGLTLNAIRRFYVRQEDNKDTRYNMSELFDRIHHYATGDDSKVKELTESYNRILKWDKYFGLI